MRNATGLPLPTGACILPVDGSIAGGKNRFTKIFGKSSTIATAPSTAQRDAQEREHHNRAERDGPKSGPDRPVRENDEEGENYTEQRQENRLLPSQKAVPQLVACEKSNRNRDRRQVIGKSGRRRDKRRGRQGCRLQHIT